MESRPIPNGPTPRRCRHLALHRSGHVAPTSGQTVGGVTVAPTRSDAVHAASTTKSRSRMRSDWAARHAGGRASFRSSGRRAVDVGSTPAPRSDLPGRPHAQSSAVRELAAGWISGARDRRRPWSVQRPHPTGGTAGRLFVPLHRTELNGEVAGPLASLRLTQTFRFTRAQHPGIVEALYRFPLPGDAGVSGVTVRFGEVEIRAELAERTEAERSYVAARDEGHQATLLTRESADVFTLQVAGIAPDEPVVVETAYVQLARPDGAGWSLRVPLTMAPRYVRSDEVATRGADGQPLALLLFAEDDAVPRAHAPRRLSARRRCAPTQCRLPTARPDPPRARRPVRCMGIRRTAPDCDPELKALVEWRSEPGQFGPPFHGCARPRLGAAARHSTAGRTHLARVPGPESGR